MAGKRGRPLGFKLSDFSKTKISESKKGQHHSSETKDKISSTLLRYFRKEHPLSKELNITYCNISHPEYDEDNVGYWLADCEDSINDISDVLTTRLLNVARKKELTYGDAIELLSHSMTPELLLLAKEAVAALPLSEIREILEG